MSAAVTRVQSFPWQSIHEALERLAVEQASRDFELGGLLLAGIRHSVHLYLGYGSFSEYVERLFGLTPRQVAERLRVAKALEELPELREASQRGSVCWSVVRELTRVATAETEAEWLRASEPRTARQVEELVVGRKPGDRPGDPVERRAEREVLRFEVSAEVAATWREAVSELRRRTGPDRPLSEEDALLLMARAVLGGPTDEGRASYQVAMTVCESCGRGWQQSRGELVPVDGEAVELASCDAQVIRAVEPSGDTHVGAGADDTHVGVGADNTHVGAGAGDTHVGATPARASQTIPPRVRRQVIRRQHGQCAVPGCRNSQYLDLHHLVPRAEGGTSGEDDLVALCSCHHRAAHRGYLVIEGRPSAGLEFFHADGTAYGKSATAGAIEAHASAFDALKRLGYRETEVRRALTQVRTHVGVGAPFEEVIRAAFAVLTR